MEQLNVSGLKRNPDIIKSKLKKIGKSLIANENLKVIFPERFVDKDLAIIGSTVRVVGIYIIVDDDGNYAVSNMPVFIELTPNSTSNIEIEGTINRILYFEKGMSYIENTDLMVDSRFLYDLFDDIYIKGNVPWFLDYEDVINIFSLTSKYSGSDIGDDPLSLEIITSIISRSKSDRKQYFRNSLGNTKSNSKPSYTGLMNIYYTFDNTVSKLVGSYYTQGITSAIIEKETEPTRIEEILRS